MPENFADAVLPSNVRVTSHGVTKEAASPNWTIESVSAPAELTDPKDTAKSRLQAVVAGTGTPEAEKTVSLLINGKVAANARSMFLRMEECQLNCTARCRVRVQSL